MSKVKIMFGLGIWVAILPYLGFPYSLKNILFLITGLVFIFLSYLLFKDLKKESGVETFDNFSENKDFKEGSEVQARKPEEETSTPEIEIEN